MPGDLIFTGTPEGVAAVNVGDRLVATVGELATLEVEILPVR
jgi:fumarylpyruvate hydrolase